MKIIEYTLSSREWWRPFETSFYNDVTDVRPTQSKFDCVYPEGYLGKNLSYFVIEDEGENYLFLFDVDDGSGCTICDCKIIWGNFYSLLEEHNIKDYLVFNREFSYEKQRNEYYPFQKKSVPLGILPSSEDHTRSLKRQYMTGNKQKDIDVLWIGAVVDEFEPFAWNRGKSTETYNYQWRQQGYKVLSEISERRNDLNIVCSRNKVPMDQYFDLVSRAKICLELPGVGQLNKRFIEYLIFEKCVLRMHLHCELPYPLLEGTHYYSFGDDLSNIEASIDELLASPEKLSQAEAKVKEFQNFLSYDWTKNYIKTTVKDFIRDRK